MLRKPDPTEPDAVPERRDADSGDEDGEDTTNGVAYRPNPLPLREEDEEELSHDDILEELDLDELEVDDEVAK